MATYRASYSASEKRLFADRLRKAMLEQGLRGAELARRASKHLPKPIPRQLISSWVTGASIPEEPNVRALEKALDIPPGFLLPRPHNTAPGEPSPAPDVRDNDVRMSLVGDGKMRLTLSVEVSQATGWEILNLLKQEGH